ncbi:MAG: diguanylate cyclase [Acidobacteriia bacterium]|nr:diguanylate cyclase [Terriglobia bacterium]
MPDISKHLERAEKFLQKGRQDAALDEYLQALELDPGNDQVRQTVADLYIAQGRVAEGAKLLSQQFDHEVAINDTPKAVANYKKLVRVGTPTVDQTFKFAQLIEKSSRGEAMHAYQAALRGFESQGRKQEGLGVLKRVIALDPSEENYKREGELAAELGDGQTAAVAFLQVGMFAAKAGTDPLPWYQRAHQMDSHNADVALAYGKTLYAAGMVQPAITVLEPLATADNSRVEYRQAYSDALVAARRLVEAEPLIWELFERDPKEVNEVGELIAALLDEDHQPHALELAHKLEVHQLKAGNQREFVALMKDIADKHPAGIEFLEYMVEVYNASNREHDYCGTLLKLFELYYASGNFIKAADCLDRAAEVDAYEPGHQRRLDMLRGKIDGNHFNAIASRFSSVLKLEEKESDTPETPEGETTVLEDLMLQAEIFLQYAMRAKAVERLERIHKLFPREEEKNEKLRELYMTAGFTPQYKGAPPLPPATGPGSAAPVFVPAAAAASPVAAGNEAEVDNFTRITDITRNIYRQGSVKGVLFTAVNEIGRHWNASRCIAGLCTPGKPPSATLEYCSPGVQASDIMAIVKMVMTCLALSVTHGIVKLLNVPSATELDGIRENIQGLGIESVLAVPLMDGDEFAGIVILEQCAPRNWRPTDEVVLKTIAEQMILAVNNARLRSLVKTLAVTDERSGLLKRTSYLDVLLSEVKRCQEQNSTCSVMLMHFGKTSSLVKEYGEAAVETLMQQLGQIINGHIRQNDVAVRYDLTTIALLLADTGEKNGFFVVDKLRKVMASVHLPGKSTPPSMTVGIAEAVMQNRFDPVDIVCELINRAESALAAAKSEGANTVKALSPTLDTATVTA